MIRDCDIKNPLLRDGTSQANRMLQALKPDYVKVDERSLADLLYNAYQYSKELQYYNSNDEPDGDWKAFIENDISTTIAIIANKDLGPIKSCFDEKIKILESHSSKDERKKSLEVVFVLIFITAFEINEWYIRSVEGQKLKDEIGRIITSQLRRLFSDISGLYRYAKEKKFIGNVISNIPDDCRRFLEKDVKIMNLKFDTVWNIKGPDTSFELGPYISSHSTDDFAFSEKVVLERIPSIYEIFYNAQVQLVSQSPDYINETIENWPNHEPHMALFISFLKLFKYAQDHINTITQRHLDFYYKEVLLFKERNAIPDKVHIILELAKQSSSHLLKKGTLLKAGKDATGVEVVYETDKDIVLNKAKIQKLMTVFIDTDDNYRIYSAPVANSIDGIGGEFDSDGPKWKTFGETQLNKDSNTYRSEKERTMQNADIGFAIATPQLILNEGTRTVTLTLTFDSIGFEQSELESNVGEDSFRFYLSGENEWIEPEEKSVSIGNNTIVFQVQINEAQEAIVSYNKKKLKVNYNTSHPVLKVILNHDNSAYAYKFLKSLKIANANIKVSVTNVKNLLLQNDQGKLDPNKPFQAFGQIPSKGSNFYIGSREVFFKKIKSLTINIDWHDLPQNDLVSYYEDYKKVLVDSIEIVSNEIFTTDIKYLQGKKWETIIGVNEKLFDKDDATAKRVIGIDSDKTITIDRDNVPAVADMVEYTNQTVRGFIKLELNAPDFLHKSYPIAITKVAIDKIQNITINTPYTPTIKCLSIDYDSDQGFEAGKEQFFLISPFGHEEVLKKSGESVPLLSQFQYSTDGTPVDNVGELYIGITDLKPRQNLSIFFQVAEGSENPELPKADVNWSYLGDNWTPFEEQEILSDTTNGIITSGIVTFDIPKSANKESTRFQDANYWIRASVTKNAGAVCDIIDVQTQATQASFHDNGNDAYFLAENTPEGTISKLKIKDSEIKKIKQPYASFDGRIKEQSSQFYTRVSERLRHKSRGIPIWDYERLVLERFPSIYKVKCINHSTYNFKKNHVKISRSEFAPGYVTVVVIPNLKNKNAVDQLEPRVSLNTLEKIKDYLSNLISPFAAQTLQVINPLYETVKVEFFVKFHLGYDWGFYKKKLNEEIIDLLSPWISNEGKDIIFGGKIHQSVILDFVEERPYVDFVTDFMMSHITHEDINPLPPVSDVEEIVTTTARSILVSDKLHIIKEIKQC